MNVAACEKSVCGQGCSQFKDSWETSPSRSEAALEEAGCMQVSVGNLDISLSVRCEGFGWGIWSDLALRGEWVG